MNDVQHKIPTVQATMEDVFFKLGGSPDDSDEEKYFILMSLTLVAEQTCSLRRE